MRQSAKSRVQPNASDAFFSSDSHCLEPSRLQCCVSSTAVKIASRRSHVCGHWLCCLVTHRRNATAVARFCGAILWYLSLSRSCRCLCLVFDFFFLSFRPHKV